MLKTLTEFNAVSGDEDRLRKFLINQIKPYADDIKVDTIGNIIAFKKGKNATKKINAVIAHMDEVGFIITKIEENGFLRFEEVGGISDAILLTQKVEIGDEKVSGILGVKAVHLQSKDERQNLIKMKNMYIDIGAKNKEEAEKKVKIGDYVAFASRYIEFGNDKIKAKAIDDRVGVFAILELIKKEYNEDIYFCFTTQEETGLRGAKILSHRLNADTCLVLEGTNAADVEGVKKHETVTNLGFGPALSVMDRASISSIKYNDFIKNVANENNLKYQLKKTLNGGNDAGSMAYGAKGCMTAVLSLPVRYLHSPISVAQKSDINDLINLTECVLKNIENLKPERKEVIK